MLRFFPNAKRSLDSLLVLITDLVTDGLLFFRLLFRSHSPQRGSPVFAKAAGLLSGETSPTKTIERLRPFFLNPLASTMQLERGLGHRQIRDRDRLASQEFPVVLEMEVASRSATNS